MPASRPRELFAVTVMLTAAQRQWLLDRSSAMTGYSKILRDLIEQERFRKGF